mmetsp:Transcript_32145/g.55517  ORF Transcript_32145/g.55517 Transcript_32145/m.55517 type:complete len:350 (+) Transcript_32145:392-1441(+)
MDGEVGKGFEISGAGLLRRELAKLEAEILTRKKQLKNEKERLERMSSQLHLTKQQIDFFTQESQRALEGIKDANWQFTKEVCSELSKVKNPSSVLLDVSEKFMLMLDQRDRSWKTFRAVTRNFGPLKSLMSSVSAEHMSEDQLNELLPIWKKQQSLVPKLASICKGAAIIAEWIRYCVEYKLKKETLVASKRKLPDIERRMKAQLAQIADRNAQILTLEERVAETKLSLESGDCQSFDAEAEEYVNSLDASVVSMKTTTLTYKHEERAIVSTPLRKGTASGGIMTKASPRHTFEVIQAKPQAEKQEMPNFNLELHELYQEAPVQEEVVTIQIEGPSDVVGCCRSRFFCF